MATLLQLNPNDTAAKVISLCAYRNTLLRTNHQGGFVEQQRTRQPFSRFPQTNQTQGPDNAA